MFFFLYLSSALEKRLLYFFFPRLIKSFVYWSIKEYKKKFRKIYNTEISKKNQFDDVIWKKAYDEQEKIGGRGDGGRWQRRKVKTADYISPR